MIKKKKKSTQGGLNVGRFHEITLTNTKTTRKGRETPVLVIFSDRG